MKLISGLAEGQVLQRRGKAGATAVLRGETTVSGPVIATVTQSGRPLAGWTARKAGAARNGGFTVTLKGIPAGGPYRLKLASTGKGATGSCEVKSFYVGDVWILAGQSNMEGAGKLPGFAKPHPLVRALSQSRVWRQATDPLHVHVESPDVCHNYGNHVTPAMAEDFRRRAAGGAGVGVHFGRERVERTGVPQGLICVARGGSSLELWHPETRNQLYDSMMASVRVTGQPVAGVLWYQGESDTSQKSTPFYTENMQRLIAAVRSDLKQPALPWVIVQLARVFRSGDSVHWDSVQEQQRRLPSVVKNLATVAAIDLTLDDEIHIGADSMARLGARLAHGAAVVSTEGAKSAKKPVLPALRAVRRAHSTESVPAPKCAIDVEFSGVEGALRADGEPSGFSLHDANGVELPWIYRTTLHGNVARLFVMRLPTPGSTISYGRGHAPRCNLADARDLAMPVFIGQPIADAEGLLPFVTQWRVSPVGSTTAGIETVARAPIADAAWTAKTYENGFVNEHDAWRTKSGHAFFSATLELDKPAAWEFLMGYDGPFRLWLDGKVFYTNARGANPCIADESAKLARLSAGRHAVVVGMDIAHGRSWGFFLRFRPVAGGKGSAAREAK